MRLCWITFYIASSVESSIVDTLTVNDHDGGVCEGNFFKTDCVISILALA